MTNLHGQEEDAKFMEMILETTTTWKEKYQLVYLFTEHRTEESMEGKKSQRNLICRKSIGQKKDVQEKRRRQRS
eukprot:8141334-Karenia_brevis.AAC.1